ncbi:hypothetical protein EYF80_043714 [Liparis tanakae]|uniref:Uncharacterized protein n=1 Tax=Liparis tanakae TaxID=230148 RepID=A0A4Z2FXS9_9TELE|nr:hypothetical protein EYF80_043714 [Liparis tanakae]
MRNDTLVGPVWSSGSTSPEGSLTRFDWWEQKATTAINGHREEAYAVGSGPSRAGSKDVSRFPCRPNKTGVSLWWCLVGVVVTVQCRGRWMDRGGCGSAVKRQSHDREDR